MGIRIVGIKYEVLFHVTSNITEDLQFPSFLYRRLTKVSKTRSMKVNIPFQGKQNFSYMLCDYHPSFLLICFVYKYVFTDLITGEHTRMHRAISRFFNFYVSK